MSSILNFLCFDGAEVNNYLCYIRPLQLTDFKGTNSNGFIYKLNQLKRII